MAAWTRLMCGTEPDLASCHELTYSDSTSSRVHPVSRSNEPGSWRLPLSIMMSTYSRSASAIWLTAPPVYTTQVSRSGVHPWRASEGAHRICQAYVVLR